MNDTIRVWTRKELEEAAAIEPEAHQSMLKVAITPLLLLRLIEYCEQGGDRIEMLSAYGDPERCELRFFKSDVAKGTPSA